MFLGIGPLSSFVFTTIKGFPATDRRTDGPAATRYAQCQMNVTSSPMHFWGAFSQIIHCDVRLHSPADCEGDGSQKQQMSVGNDIHDSTLSLDPLKLTYFCLFDFFFLSCGGLFVDSVLIYVTQCFFFIWYYALPI